MPKANSTRPQATLLAHALSYPGASEEHPWGETAIKVGKKIFAFFGRPGAEVSVTVKLPDSGVAALALPFAEPTGYGLGKSGWVTFRFGAGEAVPTELLRRFMDESYRAVAPKKLVATLEERAPGATPRSGSPHSHKATRRPRSRRS